MGEEKSTSKVDKKCSSVLPFEDALLAQTWLAHYYCGHEQPILRAQPFEKFVLNIYFLFLLDEFIVELHKSRKGQLTLDVGSTYLIL